MGICEKQSPVVDPVLEEFNNSVQFDEGRYTVSLPWKNEEVKQFLLDNQKLAKSRLDRLTCRLVKNPDLEARYHEVFCGMQKEGVIEEVPMEEKLADSHPVFYLPHRPVVKESSTTTKVRPVFDASAKGFNGVSLNDCLNTGPSFLPDLPGILLRFRRWKVALVADVTKAFLQIKVRPEDRDVHRFLWYDQGVTKVMRFARVPFGNKSGPFLLNATMKYHLAQYPPSYVKEELSENLYMDDWLSGCDSDSQACEMLQEAHGIMSEASMSLAKWGSNSDQVSEVLYKSFRDKTIELESFKVLGMQWTPSQDCFLFEGIEISADLCLTKRLVLSFISQLFDPLGFLTPFIMTAKCLFQQIWRLGLDWDQVLPGDMQETFSKWMKDLDVLKEWRIPRRYSETLWSETIACQLHCFGDASQQTYGACVYLVVQGPDGMWSSSLVLSRAKVAPLKRISLPRLELLASVLCARLLVYVKQALKLNEDVECHCWTDSTVALAWIQSDPYKWKAFVGNRVAGIQDLVSPSQWHHCSGKENPADAVTRGISAEELMKSRLWLHGPVFLTSGVRSDGSTVVVSQDTGEQQADLDIVCAEQSGDGSTVVVSRDTGEQQADLDIVCAEQSGDGSTVVVSRDIGEQQADLDIVCAEQSGDGSTVVVSRDTGEQQADLDIVCAEQSGDGSTVVVSRDTGEQQADLDIVCAEQSKQKDSPHTMIVLVEEEAETEQSVFVSTGPVTAIERYSSLTKAMRVMGYVLRFVQNLRVSADQRRQGDLSFKELSEAKFHLLKQAQSVYDREVKALKNGEPVSRSSPIFKLSPFLGQDGLLRIQGRLQFAGLPIEAQHPIIVPKGHLGLLLARHTHSTMKHAGVNSMLVKLRDQFWTVGARRIFKAVKKECMSCQRLDAPSGAQTMAPLPKLRVQQAPPFSVTGLDHAGPLYGCDFPGKKFYVLLFTCAVIRAVHLELVDSMSCEATVMALRRFFARRGIPSVLMSDNAKGLQAARAQLMAVLSSDAPDWKFIAPRAPWWGGWWDRLVASAKSALKGPLGKRSLSRQELETLLHETEACINARLLHL